ncbi:MAG: hypothetical protein U0T31_04945 [Chitinophagales bacterium]
MRTNKYILLKNQNQTTMPTVYNAISVKIIVLILALFYIVPSFANDLDVIAKSKSIVKSIWKYEQNTTKFSPEDGILKKIYYLSLSSDGTYHQFVQVVPLTPQDYFRVRNYSVDGKWSEKDGKLILNEYGKENAIDYSFLFSNFENIDNQIVEVKK